MCTLLFLAQNITKGAEISLARDQPMIQVKVLLFHCDSEEWVSLLAKCDNVIDCVNASDELNCSSNDKGNVLKCFYSMTE